MKTVVIASNNAHKIDEIRAALDFEGWEFKSLREAQVDSDPEEDAATFEGNARIKARAAHELCGLAVLADDSGLEVDALDGAPGVLSARYAGVHGDDAANNRLLLEKMKDVPEKSRGAYFESCVALCLEDGRAVTASGRTYGRILQKEEGNGGFGYDPLFFSDELGKSFGIAEPAEKNGVSHRGKALRTLSERIRELGL